MRVFTLACARRVAGLLLWAGNETKTRGNIRSQDALNGNGVSLPVPISQGACLSWLQTQIGLCTKCIKIVVMEQPDGKRGAG